MRRVEIQQCQDLMLGLDLTGVNPLSIPFQFKNCGKISFSYINFDEQFAGGQILTLDMDTVTSVVMEGLDVTDALQVGVTLETWNHFPQYLMAFDAALTWLWHMPTPADSLSDLLSQVAEPGLK